MARLNKLEIRKDTIMKIKNHRNSLAAAALLTGSLNGVLAEEPKETALKKSNRPSRQAIVPTVRQGCRRQAERDRTQSCDSRVKETVRPSSSDRASESDPSRQRIATARKLNEC